MAKRKNRTRRVKRTKRARVGVGAAPGVVTTQPGARTTSARLLAYGEDDLVERPLEDVAELEAALRDERRVVWVDVEGLADGAHRGDRPRPGPAPARARGRRPHPPARQGGGVPDVPLRGGADADRDPAEPGLELEQVSLFFGERFVLTFRERPGDCFEPVCERLRRSRGRFRHSGSDYLAYALLDAVVDSYFPIVESYGDRLEELEDRILTKPDSKLVNEIHAIKRDLVMIRRAVWPLREAVSQLVREEHERIRTETRLYLRDVHDHTHQLVELTETQREVAAGMLDIYLSSMSHRMNEVMKVLTIIATIFIPLSFVASVYGMNFDRDVSPWNMPELTWRYGYPFALALMTAIAVGMLVYFRRKRWI